MKKIFIVLLITAASVSAIYANGQNETTDGYEGYGAGSGMGQGYGRGAGNGQGRGNAAGTSYREDFIGELSSVYNITPGSGTLSAAEKDGLILMREEEKLARDVYNALYETWNLPVFRNIAESEQQHSDAVKLLLDAYNMEDPVENDVPGRYENPQLQKLYDDLTAQGKKSLSDALTVGATVEDLDIYDLQRLIAEADNEEVKVLYQNLMKGSRNHMRSFTAQLERQGFTYEAAYISDEYLERIFKINREMAPITDPDYQF